MDLLCQQEAIVRKSRLAGNASGNIRREVYGQAKNQFQSGQNLDRVRALEEVD